MNVSTSVYTKNHPIYYCSTNYNTRIPSFWFLPSSITTLILHALDRKTHFIIRLYAMYENVIQLSHLTSPLANPPQIPASRHTVHT